MPEDDPKYDNVKYLAGNFAKEFYDSMLRVGESLEARGRLPQDAEEFADRVTYTVFDHLAGAMMKLNRRDPLPDDTGTDGDS